MKYLKNLPTHDFYESFINGEQFEEIQELKKDVVSFCKQEQHIHYNPYIPPVPKVLDILYSDNNGNLSFKSGVLPISAGKTPIALCIAPPNFFGTGEPARWMSLKYMNYNTPDTGSLTDSGFILGNIFTLKNTQTYSLSELYKDSDLLAGYLPVDYYNATTDILPDILDTNNNWNLTVLGAANQQFMTAIDGKTITNNIATVATAQSTWQTDQTIENNGGAGYAPAICCTKRYHTLGTQSGDWYIGALGEMILIAINKTAINSKLAAISQIYSNDCMHALASVVYWTTTFNNNWWRVYRINFNTGYIAFDTSDNWDRTVALLQY